MNQLDDIHWVELYADLGAKSISKILGCSVKAATEAIRRAEMTSRAKTAADMMVIREFFPYWPGKLVARGLTRHLRVVYSWARKMGLKKGYTRRVEGFWDEWRGYIQEHVDDLASIAPYVVVRPREEPLECGNCTYSGCDFRGVLPCEDLTLWDLCVNV